MLKDTDKGPLTFLRFGLPRTKELLKDISKIYDGLVIPSNILLYQYKSTPAIIYNLQKSYFCDPMSYLFAHSFDTFKKRLKRGIAFKPSFEKLLKGYGLNPDNFINNTNKLTDYLQQNPQNLTSFVDYCLDFQCNQVEKILLSEKDLVQITDTSLLKPSFVIPPYFLYKNGDAESQMNFQILDYCNTNRDKWPNTDIFPMVFIERSSLYDDDYPNTLINKLNEYQFPGFCLWIEGFKEKDAQPDEILKVINLVKGLSQNKTRQVVMLFGGFFSMLLYNYGVNCICHGLAYSEDRAITASTSQSSGPAPVRYYIPDLHQFLTIEKALTILRARPDLICECPICQRVIQDNPENISNFNGEENLAIMHFLYKRYEERNMISTSSSEDMVQYLNYIAEINREINLITHEERPAINASCLANWSNAIQQAENAEV